MINVSNKVNDTIDGNNYVVSVLMITYNHEKYISEAIEGVLNQQTNFPVELILCNDFSSDGTHEVIQKHIENNNNDKVRIRYFNHNENIGMMPNFIFSLNKCSGKYVAICEGDDYWTDSHKLQKQVNYLEANESYSMCFTNGYFIVEANKFELIEENLFANSQIPSRTIPQSELLFQNFILTTTVLFRNRIEYPSWLEEVQLGDWALHILNSFSGKTKYLNSITGAYRLHRDSNFSAKSKKQKLISYIKTGEIIRESIEASAGRKMLPGQRSRLADLLNIYKQEKQGGLFLKYFLKYHHILTLSEKRKQFISLNKLITKEMFNKIKSSLLESLVYKAAQK